MRLNQLVKQMLLVCVCLLSLTGHAMADALSDAEHAYNAKDYVKAAKLYRPLAEQSNVAAQLRLAEMYEGGQGVLQDYKEAAKWTRLAAEQGDAVAQSMLGAMYKDGEGVPQDYVLAHMWTNIASVNEISKSGHSFDIEQRDFIATHMTTQQITEAQELARKCTANKFKGC